MIATGLLAGAAGTAALDLVTSVDMLVRARPPSAVPAEVAKRLAQTAGVTALADDGDAPKNRRTAAGAVLGYGVGLGAAAVYAAVRPACARYVPWPLAGLVLGAATLAVSEGSATRLGATDWSTWSAADWIADIIPRSVYGLTVAYVVEALTGVEEASAGHDVLVTTGVEAIDAEVVADVENFGLVDEGSVSTTSP